jgi:hypothetical protein
MSEGGDSGGGGHCEGERERTYPWSIEQSGPAQICSDMLALLMAHRGD